MAWKSANAHWSVNLLIKKTSESSCSFGAVGQVKNENLRDSYEQLREYCLTSSEAPSRPLGLDLWIKKGFLSWSMAIFSGESPQKLAPRAYAQADNAVMPEGLSISLANILMDWSDKNGGQQNQERASKP